ncbi:hypothetical protein PsorP6_012588 [Peronosclerospora sorghi]|uniref:Uncharacterized protein n=1 Tax=Peronosclerospora sorghi TaxID=230839 RepID=A0ACC0WJ49_9STRA|nr:hypothetical protein PsorP6_012588 [Peronosclerospora sorghi]
MQLLHHILLLAVITVSTTANVVDVPGTPPRTDPARQRMHLRGLLHKFVTRASTPPPVRQLTVTWENGNVGEARRLVPLKEKIVGGETLVVFHDRRASPSAETESAIVAFDVRSSPNCVVSVCGELTQWYMGSKEQCFDLHIAPKSPNEHENGHIRGVLAAYSGQRPVASNLYLKFDKSNFIDGSRCEYEILAGTKTVREEEVLSGTQVATA